MEGNRLGSTTAARMEAESPRSVPTQDVADINRSRTTLPPPRVEVEFSRQDSQQLALLLDIPTPQLTGRQWEDLHNVFYRKHPDRNTRFMDQREMHVHIKLDAMEESHRQLPQRNDPYRMSTPVAGSERKRARMRWIALITTMLR